MNNKELQLLVSEYIKNNNARPSSALEIGKEIGYISIEEANNDLSIDTRDKVDVIKEVVNSLVSEGKVKYTNTARSVTGNVLYAELRIKKF